MSEHTTDELIKLVEEWSVARNIHNADSKGQMVKVTEEVGEVAKALLRKDMPELEDGIGDTVVTLIILAQQNGLTLNQCLESAYNVIKDRTGETRDGVYIKQEDIPLTHDNLITEMKKRKANGF